MSVSITCHICLEKSENLVAVCNNFDLFHFDCIQTWASRGKKTCPLCREDILHPDIVFGEPDHADQIQEDRAAAWAQVEEDHNERNEEKYPRDVGYVALAEPELKAVSEEVKEEVQPEDFHIDYAPMLPIVIECDEAEQVAYRREIIRKCESEVQKKYRKIHVLLRQIQEEKAVALYFNECYEDHEDDIKQFNEQFEISSNELLSKLQKQKEMDEREEQGFGGMVEKEEHIECDIDFSWSFSGFIKALFSSYFS